MENNERWFDNETTTDVLLFLFFPLGLYALYKTGKIKPKASKVFYGFLGFISLFLTLIFISKF